MSIDFKLRIDGIEADSANVTALNFSLVASDGTYETIVNGRCPAFGLAYDGLTLQDSLDYLTANLADATLADMQKRAAEWIAGQYNDTPKQRDKPWTVKDADGKTVADEPVAVAVSKLVEADVAAAVDLIATKDVAIGKGAIGKGAVALN